MRKGTLIIGGFAANKIEFCEFKDKKKNIIKKKYYENPKMYMVLVIKIYFEIIKALQNKKNQAIQAKDSIESLKFYILYIPQ